MHSVLGLSDFPDVLDDSLSVPGVTLTCCHFNRQGTLVAAGSREGHIVLFDFLTRSVAKTLSYPPPHLIAAAPPLIDPASPYARPPPPVVSVKSERFVTHSPTSVTCCGWSSNSRRLLCSYGDGLVGLWDVLSGELLSLVKHTSWIKQAQIQPRDSLECLLCPNDEEPLVAHFHKQPNLAAEAAAQSADAAGVAPSGASTSLLTHSIRPLSASSFPSADTKKETLTFALYDHTGHYIVAGGSKCGLFVFARDGLAPLSTQAMVGGRNSSVLSMCRSNCGRFLLVHTADRTLRLWANTNHTSKPALPSSSSAPPAPPQFSHVQDHADVVDRIAWKRATFSHTADYLVGGRGDRFSHQLYVWDRVAQQHVRTIDGAEEGLVDVAFHPTQCFMLVVGTSGRCYVWCKRVERIAEAVLNAFAPDFTVLDDNEEYVEREDEFDVKHSRTLPPTHGAARCDKHAEAAVASVADAEVEGEGGGVESEETVLEICGLDGEEDVDGEAEEDRPLLTLPLERTLPVSSGNNANNNSEASDTVRKRQRVL